MRKHSRSQLPARSNRKLTKSNERGSSFEQSKRLKRRPQVSAPDETSHRCEQCNKGFPTNAQLNFHIRYNSLVKPYHCQFCEATFKLMCTLYQHLLKHGDENRYTCQYCSETVTNIRAFYRHLQEHFVAKPFKCRYCDKTFKQVHALSLHERAFHIGEKPFVCDVCKTSFAYSHGLASHMRLHTGDRPHRCEDCGAAFAHLNTLRVHQRMHSGAKPYKCTECPKTFAQHAHLRSHRRIHTGERPYHCPICSKSFTQTSHRRVHVRTHTGERQYQCEDCDKMFPTLSSLRSHMIIHTKRRPFKCKFCTREFRYQYYVVEHERLHSGATPYSCTKCDKAYASWRTLCQHLKCTHAGVSECKYCDEKFKNLFDLQKHLRMQHPYGNIADCMTSSNPRRASRTLVCADCNGTFSQCVHECSSLSTRPFGCQFRCAICRRMIPAIIVSYVDESFRSQETAFHCPYCAEKFSLPEALTEHMGDHWDVVLSEEWDAANPAEDHKQSGSEAQTFTCKHGSSSKLYKCGHCWKSFETPELIRRHMMFSSVVNLRLISSLTAVDDSQSLRNVSGDRDAEGR